jgi:hypothetical protein
MERPAAGPAQLLDGSFTVTRLTYRLKAVKSGRLVRADHKRSGVQACYCLCFLEGKTKSHRFNGFARLLDLVDIRRDLLEMTR